MKVDIEQIATLEWINYEATLATARVSPDLELSLRKDVILTSSEIFPDPTTTHACLLRATPETADALIEEIVDYFQSKNLTPTISLSPACTPADLPKRLLKRGFKPQKEKEVWLTFPKFLRYKIPPPMPKAVIKQIKPDEAMTFCEIFMTAFEMPVDFAPAMAQLVTPSIGLPNFFHYLAFVDDQPVGTLLLACYQDVGFIGAAGVIPEYRGGGASYNLIIQAGHDAQQLGCDALVLQTTAGTKLERYLRMAGFKKTFTRTNYTLS